MRRWPLHARIRKERRHSKTSSFQLDVDLQVPAAITILFGPSGSGKSTLLDCIAGLERPDSGTIAIGEEVFFFSEENINRPPQKRKIAYVFQTLALFPHLNVNENVGYGLARDRKQERKERVEEILRAFHIENLQSRKPSEISGGERQRVALARSLVTQPKVLLLDEPLAGLDARLKNSILQDLRSWNAERQIPILYVTHSREEVDALGERVVALEDGRIVGTGSPSEVLEAPRRVSIARLAGFENILAATVRILRPEDGIMRVLLENSPLELEVPLGHATIGSKVRVAIRAGDILLAKERPRGLSARNIFEGKIISLELRGVMILAGIDCGTPFTVHVTLGAARDLRLEVGAAIWLILKTYSCHLLTQ